MAASSTFAASILGERARRNRIAAQKGAAEDDLLAFVKMFWHAVEPAAIFQDGWVLEAMCDFLMSVTDGENNRAMLNVPPGSMKSLLLNVFFPAWEWGPRNMPHMRYISVSYSSTLTERDNGRMLRILTDPIYKKCWPHVVMTKEGVGKIENTKTGWKLATSVNGTMTGQRGNRVLLDDANNPMDVESADVRGATNRFLREVMPDRLNNLEEDAIVSIQQRTHEEDATGTLAKYGTGYVWMMIPMEFDPLRTAPVVLARDDEGNPTDVWHDPRGLDDDGEPLSGMFEDARGNIALRPGSPMALAEGELMWPNRFSADAMAEQRKAKGPYAYAGQYQQMPTQRGGAIIQRDWWQVWSSPTFPDFGTVIASLDTALEEKTESDYNAIIGLGAFPSENGNLQLMLRLGDKKRCKLAELVKWVAEHCYKIKADYLLIEHKTRGRDVFDEIQRIYANAPWQTILLLPQGDKVSRLNAVANLFSGDMRKDPATGIDVYEGGIIFAPETDWADEVINETATFPKGAHDDLVDALSQAVSWVRKNGVVVRKVEHELMEEEGKKFLRSPGVPYTIKR
jgi:predicted phage terminase large subunit-like protein